MNSESILSLKYFFASDLNTIGANCLKGSLSLIFKFKSRLIFGFKSLATNNIAIINLSHLQKFHDNKKIDLNTPVDLKSLQNSKILNKKYIKLKILGDGDLKNKVNITANYVSKQAQTKIEKVGGTLNIVKKYVPKQNTPSVAKKLTENPNTSKK